MCPLLCPRSKCFWKMDTSRMRALPGSAPQRNCFWPISKTHARWRVVRKETSTNRYVATARRFLSLLLRSQREKWCCALRSTHRTRFRNEVPAIQISLAHPVTDFSVNHPTSPSSCRLYYVSRIRFRCSVGSRRSPLFKCISDGESRERKYSVRWQLAVQASSVPLTRYGVCSSEIKLSPHVISRGSSRGLNMSTTLSRTHRTRAGESEAQHLKGTER